MALNKYRLGDLIELLGEENTDLQYGIEDVRGVNNLKELMPTKADLNGRDLSKFQIVNPGEFFFNHRTSRNGAKFSITYNYESDPIICTEDYVVFKIKSEYEKILIKEWLYMFFNRSEFDRYVITNSWGSSTEFYNWDDICSVELVLPDYKTQKKYVDVYNSMLANQQSYERGLEDLKLVCDAYIENLRRNMPCETIGKYISEYNVRNEIGLSLDSVRGIATSKEFIDTKANMDGVALDNYKIVERGMIAFIPDTSRRADKISLALNQSNEAYLVSSIATVVTTNERKLLPKYLYLFLVRTEFDRYARFHSWGSAREAFSFDDMKEVSIPIPELEIQKSIVEIHEVYSIRKEINAKLKSQMKVICPILIKGSVGEARKTKET
ncbi:MAG: restriction endonuclease subunit S [Lachnospiraceae bacterium]|nr:restriction endonuclease subunit S [Lachnospiraceae bacterium]MCM1239931.1 restriction endonuclease subunit S [Lachnospiraceae bacterium]